jgi:hypothetical protein
MDVIQYLLSAYPQENEFPPQSTGIVLGSQVRLTLKRVFKMCVCYNAKIRVKGKYLDLNIDYSYKTH